MLESLYNKIGSLKACNFIKKRLQQMCFPLSLAKFLRKPLIQNSSRRMVLTMTLSAHVLMTRQKLTQNFLTRNFG